MAVALKANYPDFLTVDALPWLEEIIDQGRKVRPEEFRRFFRMNSTDKPHVQYTSFGTLGTFVQTDENDDVTFDVPNQGFDKTLTPLQYSLGFSVSKIAFDDDKIGPLRNLASHLGRSYTESRNILAADIFNNGFSNAFTGADGVELFSSLHLQDGSSVTFRNELATTADLSITSLRTALIDLRNFRDGRNKRINLRPNKLIIPPDLEFEAREILQSVGRSDTANRADNVFPKAELSLTGDSINVWNYLTDTDAWFLQAPEEDHWLIFLEREAFNVASDVRFRNRALETAAWSRFDIDWVNNGTGIFGVEGA